MRLLSLCLPLLCLGFDAAAHNCQNNAVIQQSLQDKIFDDPDRDIVSFLGYTRFAPVPDGVECEAVVTLSNPGVINGTPPGFFEGVTQTERQGVRPTVIVRELAVQPSLGVGDEVDLYQLAMDEDDGARQELLVRLIADSVGSGTIYVLRLVYPSGNPKPDVQILLESKYIESSRKQSCMGEDKPICLSIVWDGGRRSPQLWVRLKADSGASEKGLYVDNLPKMQMGYLGGVYRSGHTSSVRLKHKVCQLDDEVLLSNCGYTSY